MLDKIIQEKKKELEMIYFDRYSPLFVDALYFLSNKKALLYGGMALNEILPTTLKFYDPYSLPDIDVLSPYAKKLAGRMVSFYKKKKHEAVSFTEALHPGTYKVFADGVQIADITQCTERTYETLLHECVRTPQGIKIVPPTYLRMTLHKILSQPNDAHRWKNVYERIHRFYKVYPVSCKLKKRSEDPSSSLTTVMTALYTEMQPDTIFFGKEQVELMMGKRISWDLPPFLALTSQDLTELSHHLEQVIPNLHVSKAIPMDDLILPHIALSVGKHTIGIIFQLASCVAYNDLKGRRIASIHTMLDLFLSMFMSKNVLWKRKHTFLKCLTDELSYIQQNTPTTRKVRKELILSCYGPNVGVNTLRRERAKRILIAKKKTRMSSVDVYG